MLAGNKIIGEEIKFLKKKIKFLYKSKTTAIKRKFRVKSDKKQKTFFCTAVPKFLEILTLNICNGAKQIYPKKQKKKVLRKDILQLSVAVIWRFNVTKMSFIFKVSSPVYLNIIKIDIK